MNKTQTNQIQPTLPLDIEAAAEARKEREAVKWCERLDRKLNAKRSDYQPKRRRRVDRR